MNLLPGIRVVVNTGGADHDGWVVHGRHEYLPELKNSALIDFRSGGHPQWIPHANLRDTVCPDGWTCPDPKCIAERRRQGWRKNADSPQ